MGINLGTTPGTNLGIYAWNLLLEKTPVWYWRPLYESTWGDFRSLFLRTTPVVYSWGLFLGSIPQVFSWELVFGTTPVIYSWSLLFGNTPVVYWRSLLKSTRETTPESSLGTTLGIYSWCLLLRTTLALTEVLHWIWPVRSALWTSSLL